MMVTEFQAIQLSKDEVTDAHRIYWIFNAITSKNLSQIFCAVQNLGRFAILQVVEVIRKLSLCRWQFIHFDIEGVTLVPQMKQELNIMSTKSPKSTVTIWKITNYKVFFPKFCPWNKKTMNHTTLHRSQTNTQFHVHLSKIHSSFTTHHAWWRALKQIRVRIKLRWNWNSLKLKMKIS